MTRSTPLQIDDHGDLTDLQARLESVREDGDRRLVTLFGSGLSNAVVPNITQMTQLFRSYMPSKSINSFDEIVSPIQGTGLAYQNAAALLKRQRGDATLARAIRHGVLTACKEVPPDERRDTAGDIELCKHLEREGQWQVPPGYKAFANYLSLLPDPLRGPVLTTNFDPLLEIALKQSGIDVSPIPVPRDAAPTAEQIQAQHALPIIHLHGYWISNSTLSTVGQLTRKRPGLDGLLRHLLKQSVILVVGYSGWRDAFMTSLEERISESDLLESEILWSTYERDETTIASHPTLSTLEVSAWLHPLSGH